MSEQTTIIAITFAITSLFGYVLKLVLPVLLKERNQHKEEIRELTDKFLHTINHKQTEFTNAIKDLADEHRKSTAATQAQSKIFENLLKNR